MRLIFGALVAVFFLGCHSTSMAPAPRDNQHDVKSTTWLETYKAATSHLQDDPTTSCRMFKSLATVKKFPAHDVATVRAVEACPNEILDRKKLPSWLQDLAVNVMLQKAQAANDKRAEIDLALEKTKQKLPMSEKVKWASLALKDAESLKLADRLPQLKQRLFALAPRLNPAPIEKRYLSVATDYRLSRQFDKARDFYEKVLKSPSFTIEDKISALKGLRLAYKNTRKNDLHLQSAQRLIDFLDRAIKKRPKNVARMRLAAFEAELYRVRAMWTLGESTQAEKELNRIQKKYAGKVSLAELFWIKARVREESDDPKGANELLDQALKERFADKDLHDKVLWYAAWNARNLKDYPNALTRMQTLIDSTESDFVKQRTLYWVGRVQKENHQDAEAKKTYASLIDSDPLGYYGLLAHRELKTRVTLPKTASSDAIEDVKLPLDSDLVRWLDELNETDALSAYLDEASARYKKQADQSDAGWVLLFKDYARAGLYMKLFEALGTLTAEQRKNILERHPELLFPQPWAAEIGAAGEKFGIPAETIYAIIRQESAFDPYARSLADAFGLMQLLPEVGESLGAKYSIPYHEAEDLFDPKINIPIGAAHLSELFHRHEGKFILAVAAYNASESIIRGWMKSRFHGDSTEFIENIPYEETRAYVRLVMRNFVFYKLLRSNSSGLDFPEWLLKL